MRTRYIGIDPGLKGAIACLAFDGEEPNYSDSWIRPLPTHNIREGSRRRDTYDERALARLVDLHVAAFSEGDLVVALERAWARPQGGGGQGHGASANFELAYGYGLIRGMLASLGVVPVLVAPITWQRALGLARGDGKAAVAQAVVELHPQLRPSLYGPRGGLLDGRSDALAIAEYARRQQWRTASTASIE